MCESLKLFSCLLIITLFLRTFFDFSFDDKIIGIYENILTYKLQNCEYLSAKNNFFILFIFFISLVIADTGGLLGLFLGSSVLSIVELVYFFILFIANKFFKISKIHNEQLSNDNNQKIEDLHNRINQLQRRIEGMQLEAQRMRSWQHLSDRKPAVKKQHSNRDPLNGLNSVIDNSWECF